MSPVLGSLESEPLFMGLVFRIVICFNVKMKPFQNPHPEKKNEIMYISGHAMMMVMLSSVVGGGTPMVHFGYVKIETDQGRAVIVFISKRERERSNYCRGEREGSSDPREGSCGWVSDISGLIKPRERLDRCDKGTQEESGEPLFQEVGKGERANKAATGKQRRHPDGPSGEIRSVVVRIRYRSDVMEGRQCWSERDEAQEPRRLGEIRWICDRGDELDIMAAVFFR